MESIKRSEFFVALRSGMNKESKVLDVGCGVGGPLRNIHAFTGADITGVTINEYQVRVANQYCTQMGMSDKARIVQGDFQKLPELFEKEEFDVAFAIEATCHSPNRVQTFSGVHHCLKKGGVFCGYEWVVLPERGFDANNPDHIRIKEGIEVGNGLPTLATGADVLKALEDSGFEVMESFDANKNVHDSEYSVPWYETLNGSYSLTGFRMTHLGRSCTHVLVSILESLYALLRKAQSKSVPC
jgi:sterol 24-C-methyltransferase